GFRFRGLLRLGLLLLRLLRGGLLSRLGLLLGRLRALPGLLAVLRRSVLLVLVAVPVATGTVVRVVHRVGGHQHASTPAVLARAAVGLQQAGPHPLAGHLH